MPVFDTPAARLYFSHIPKTGGSSVEAYLRQKGDMSFFGPPKIDSIHRQHLHRSLAIRVLGNETFDHSFAVLRDPVARLVSEFMWRSDPLKPMQKLPFLFSKSVIRRVRVDGRKMSLTFADWVPLVLDETRKNPSHRDNHMRPQVEFLAKGDRLFAFENGLDAVFRWCDAVTDGTPSDPVTRLKMSKSAKPDVAANTRNMIEQFYADDVALHQDVLQGRSVF